MLSKWQLSGSSASGKSAPFSAGCGAHVLEHGRTTPPASAGIALLSVAGVRYPLLLPVNTECM